MIDNTAIDDSDLDDADSGVHRQLRVLLLVLIAVRGLLPDAVQYLLAGRPLGGTTTSVVVAERVLAASASARMLELALLVTVAALLATYPRHGGITRRNGALRGLLLLWFGVLVCSQAAGDPLRVSALVLGLSLFGLAIATPLEREVCRVVASVTVVVAATGLVTALLAPGLALIPSGDERTYVIANQRLTGLLSHPNSLALVLSTGFPFVVKRYRATRRIVASAIVLVALLATASRTGLLVLLLLTLFAIASSVFVILGRWAVGAAQKIGLFGFLLPAAVLAGLLPVFGYAPEALRSPGRLLLWEYSRSAWPDKPVFGHGPSFWADIASYTSGFLSFAFHAHNIWLDLLVTTGFVGTGAFAITVLWWTREALRLSGDSLLPGVTLAVVLLNGSTEVPLNLTGWDARSVVLLLGASVATSSRRRGAHGGARSSRAKESRGTPPTRKPTPRPAPRRRPSALAPG